MVIESHMILIFLQTKILDRQEILANNLPLIIFHMDTPPVFQRNPATSQSDTPNLSTEHVESMFEASSTDNPAPPRPNHSTAQSGDFQFKGFWRLFGQAWVKLFSHFWSFVGLTLYSFIPLIVGGSIISLSSVVGVMVSGSAQSNLVMGILIAVGVVIFALCFLWSLRIMFSSYTMAYKLFQGEKLSFSEALKQTKPQFGSMLWTIILSGIIILIGCLLLGIPGLVFASWLSIAIFLPIAENIGGIKAVRRSYELIKGYGWEMYVMLLSQSAVNYIIYIPLILLMGVGTFSALLLGGKSPVLIGGFLLIGFIVVIISLVLNIMLMNVHILMLAGRFFDLKQIKEHNLSKTNSTAVAVICGILLSIIILPAIGYSIYSDTKKEAGSPSSVKSTDSIWNNPIQESKNNADLAKKSAKKINDLQKIGIALFTYINAKGKFPSTTTKYANLADIKISEIAENDLVNLSTSGNILETSLVPTYLSTIPKDASSQYHYSYISNGSSFKLLAVMEKDSFCDPGVGTCYRVVTESSSITERK